MTAAPLWGLGCPTPGARATGQDWSCCGRWMATLQDQCRVLEGAGQDGGGRALHGGSEGMEAAASAPPSPIRCRDPQSQQKSRKKGWICSGK